MGKQCALHGQTKRNRQVDGPFVVRESVQPIVSRRRVLRLSDAVAWHVRRLGLNANPSKGHLPRRRSLLPTGDICFFNLLQRFGIQFLLQKR
jgi:hypothetical protein